MFACEALPFFAEDDHLAAFACFRASARALVDGHPPLRRAQAPDAGLLALAAKALACDHATQTAARDFFVRHTRPHLVSDAGFFTGYYEPVVDGALAPTPEFSIPIHGAPDYPHPHPPRADFMKNPALAPVVAYVRDWVEAFFIHVQGSACLRLVDCENRLQRLIYHGRNGHPYRSIGAVLRERLCLSHLPMPALKAWLYNAGLGQGQEGWRILAHNPSYIYFALAARDLPAPIGGAGLALTPMRSIAIDRALYAYGTLFYAVMDLPEGTGEGNGTLAKIFTAQDTGSAIVGSARADVFCGCGIEAGALAGALAQRARVWHLAPNHAAL